ncbi:xylulokinase [Poseidonocella sp. HB161398]|uniref:xylulokinase n=1 Tax=Poseidonocella sp. HB161398 TaxID=2320855 RepID=UPI001108351C|nr:xylulokinase [Poseidonocella sp. HB161398]
MYLGIDLGTSGARLLLTDGAQRVIAAAEAPCSVAHPHPGWSEQDPQGWIEAVTAALAELRTSHAAELAALKGIGFSGHMHGAVLLDAAGAPLRPCILWNDTRSHLEAAALDAMPVMREASANAVFPGFTAPKLAWVKIHEPEIFARTATVMLPKDFLLLWMTGRRVTDMSDAAGTSWLDVAARRWSEAALEASGMRAEQMPDLVEGSEVVGTLRPELAAELGLPAGVQVVAGGADNAVSACGVGALKAGQGFVSLGTSGVLLAARDDFGADPASAVHSFCHAVPGRWYQMGVILAATDSLNWLSRITGQGPAELLSGLGALEAPGKVRFAPYLSGERTPHNDSVIRAGFTGLDIADGPQDLARAVIEGVSFALRDCQQALMATGTALEQCLAIGGGTRSRYWVELLATVLNQPLDLPAKGEFGAALGAARLAICGVTGADPDTVMTRPEIGETVMPRAGLIPAYDDAYAAWRALYPSLKVLT